MIATGIGALAGDEGGSAAVEERPDEIARAVAPLGPGPAAEVIDDEGGTDPRPVASPAEGDGLGDKDDVASKQTTLDDAVGANAIDQSEGNEVDDGSDDNGGPDDVALEQSPAIDAADAADRAHEDTLTAETTAADGQPVSDSALGDDTPGTFPGEGESAADGEHAVPRHSKKGLGTLLDETAAEVDSGSTIFGSTRTKVMDLEDFEGTLDLDAYKDMFPEASQDEDDALLARVRAMGEVVIDVVPGGRVLDKRRTYRAARILRKRIKVRVHHGLSREQEKEKRYQLNEGGRHPTRKERRKIQRGRVWNLFEMRNILGLALTQEFIARHTGYSISWISELEKEFLASNSSSTEKAVKRNLNRKKTPELVERAKTLHAAGTSIDDIAKEMGVSPNTIRNWLKDSKPKADKDKPKVNTAAIGTSRVTRPAPKSASVSVPPVACDFDEPDLLKEAFDRLEDSLGSIDGLKTLWREAGSKLAAERLEACTDGPDARLKVVAQALVEFQAAADAVSGDLEGLLTAGKAGAA